MGEIIPRLFVIPPTFLADMNAIPENAQRPPRGVAVVRLHEKKAAYYSLFSLFSLLRQLMRSPRVVVELETGALWASFL